MEEGGHNWHGHILGTIFSVDLGMNHPILRWPYIANHWRSVFAISFFFSWVVSWETIGCMCIYIHQAIPQGSINQIFVGYIPYSQGIYVASFWCFQSTRLAGSLLQITEMIRNVTHLLHALWLFLVESVGNAFACLAWIVKRSLCVFAHKQAEIGGLTVRIGFVSFHGVSQKKSAFVRLGQGEGNSFVAGFNMWLCVYQ